MIHSEQINELATALALAQGEIKNPHKNKTNPHFKSEYADLAITLTTILPILSKYGLSLSQGGNGDGLLSTMLMHKSGQYLISEMKFPPFQKAQELGAILTYFRRYALCGIVGVAGDDDTDAVHENVKTHEARALGKEYAKAAHTTITTGSNAYAVNGKANEPPPVVAVPTFKVPPIVQARLEHDTKASDFLEAHYKVKFGKYNGKELWEINDDDLDDYIEFLQRTGNGKPSKNLSELVEKVQSYRSVRNLYQQHAKPREEQTELSELFLDKDLSPMPEEQEVPF